MTVISHTQQRPKTPFGTFPNITACHSFKCFKHTRPSVFAEFGAGEGEARRFAFPFEYAPG